MTSTYPATEFKTPDDKVIEWLLNHLPKPRVDRSEEIFAAATEYEKAESATN